MVGSGLLARERDAANGAIWRADDETKVSAAVLRITD
jgi:hypothetical protein